MKKAMKKTWFLLSLMVIVVSCEVKPQEIAYGSDGCSFCKMTIVDTQHAAQIVTEKGKSFKYDAIECMMNHLNAWDQAAIALYLVSDYSNPKKLIDAEHAHYLISEAIPSPMGANLSGFAQEQELTKIRLENGGDMLSWDELKKGFIKK